MSRQPTRRQFLTTVTHGAAGAGLFLAGCASKGRIEPTLPNAAEWQSRLHITNAHALRILQFTDIHFFAGKALHEKLNAQTVDTMHKLVKRVKPNLVMITGDSWPEDRDGRGEEFMRYAVAQYETLGVPWAYTWGNHDQLPDVTAGHQALTCARNALYRGANTDGNYVIDIIGHRKKIEAQLLCFNTHRIGFAKTEQDWLRSISTSLPPRIPRLAFFHIPLKQYDVIWKEDLAKGVKREQVMPEKEDGSSLALLKQSGVIACFCGHDHTNDFSGKYDGVSLVYGRATGAGGYGADKVPKGGKLITLDCVSKKCTWESVLAPSKP